MALFDYEVRLESRFNCRRPQDAGPVAKRLHELPRVYDAKQAHVHLEARIGTAGIFVDRANVNFYKGHVPDAPTMVGVDQAHAYLKGIEDTGWGRHRLLAIIGAACVGVAFGVLMGAGSIGIVALLHAAGWATTAPSWGLFIGLACFNMAFDGTLFALFEWRDWSALNKKLHNLDELCAIYQRRPHEGANAALLPDDRAFVRAMLESDCWAQQTAALELSELAAATPEEQAKAA